MSFLRPSLSSASALALILCLSPASLKAQGLMAGELWTSWQEGVARRGGALNAEQKREGNKLVLRNVHFEPILDAGVFEIEEVSLINQADGSVSVVLPETFPMVVGLPLTEGETAPREVLLSVHAPQTKVIVRGLGARADFQVEAPEITVGFEKFLPERDEGEAAGEDGEAPEVLGTLRGVDFRFQQDLSLEAPIVDAALSFESYDQVFTLKKVQADAPLATKTSLRVEGFNGAFSGAFPLSFAPVWAALIGAESLQPEAGETALPAGQATAEADPAQKGTDTPEAEGGALAHPPEQLAMRPGLLKALEDGLKLSLTIQHGPVSIVSERMSGETVLSRMDFAALDGKSGLKADQSSLGLDLGFNGLLLSDIRPAEGAGEVDSKLRLSEFAISGSLGMNGLTAPQDWSLATTLRDANLSAPLWAALDPSQRLPQDPLSLVLNLSGRFAVAKDAITGDWRPKPGRFALESLSLNINELLLAALGLEMTGKGGIAFDFADADPAHPPLPEGQISLTTKGSEAVLERLGEEGRLSQEEIRGLRLQRAILARAGAAADEVISDLDFREGGIFLNGQKIR